MLVIELDRDSVHAGDAILRIPLFDNYSYSWTLGRLAFHRLIS